MGRDCKLGAVPQPDEPRHDPASRRTITLALLLGIFLAALDALVVAPAIPSVVADLGGLRLYPWVFSAYLLSSTVTAPLFGRLADVHGRKRLYLLGAGLFLLGSALSGAAPAMPVLVAMRALQGLGAGALLPITLTLVGDLYRLEERARVQGVFASVWGIASVVGAPVGGALVEHVGWRAVFYLNLPFGLAAAAIIARRLIEPRVERRAHDLDLAGAGALTAGLTCALVALQRIGSGRSPRIADVALWAAALALLAAFARRERRAAEPLVDPALLRNRIFVAANLAGFLGFGALFSATAHVPLLVRAVQGGSAQAAGVALVPLSLAWVVASNASGRLLLRTGYRATTTLGGALIAAGSGGLALAPLDASWGLYGAMAALGLGMGLAMTGMLIAVQSAAPGGRLGIATSSVQFFRSLGGAVGMALLGAVLLGSLRAAGIDPDAVPVGGELALSDPGEAAPAALGGALRRVFATGFVLALGCLAATAAMPGGDARRHADASRR